MITTYQFPNQWNWRLFLAITTENEQLNQILDHLNKSQNCSFDLDNDCDVQPPCFVHQQDQLTGVICLDEFSFTPKDIMLCVHQLTHMMISISEVNGCPINFETTECWSYFMGNMTQMILQILLSYLDDKKNQKKKTSKRKVTK